MIIIFFFTKIVTFMSRGSEVCRSNNSEALSVLVLSYQSFNEMYKNHLKLIYGFDGRLVTRVTSLC